MDHDLSQSHLDDNPFAYPATDEPALCCYYCCLELEAEDQVQTTHIPSSRGGQPPAATHVTTCRGCHDDKGDQSEDEWMPGLVRIGTLRYYAPEYKDDLWTVEVVDLDARGMIYYDFVARRDADTFYREIYAHRHAT